MCIITLVLERAKQNMRMWRNWQTRMVQVHVKAISWGFKSLHPHQISRSKDLLFVLRIFKYRSVEHEKSSCRQLYARALFDYITIYVSEFAFYLNKFFWPYRILGILFPSCGYLMLPTNDVHIQSISKGCVYPSRVRPALGSVHLPDPTQPIYSPCHF